MSKKAVVILSIAVVVSLMIIGFFIYRASIARGMEVEIAPPAKVLIGVPFDVRVGVSNKSSNLFKNVRLWLKLPSGLAFVGSPISQESVSRELGALSGNGYSQQTFTLIALNGENTFKKISADAIYDSGYFDAEFDKKIDQNLTVGGHGIEMDIAAPQKILNGQAFETELSFKNVSGVNLSELKVRVDYPPTFTLSGATLPPDVGNNTWVLGNMLKGSEVKFKITGNVIGPDGAFFDSLATVEALLAGEIYPINKNAATIGIAPAPITLKINLNNDNEYIAAPGSDLRYTLNYVNNTDIGLRDLIVRAKLSGIMYDLSTLSSNGTFRSSDNSVTWTAANFPSLVYLAPGQSGSVSFNVRAKRDYPIKKASDKNFLLKVSATIDSPTVPYFVNEGKAESFASIENKVQGLVDLDALAYFRDAASGITNKGPMPLRLDQPTNFTIHWRITNYATDVKDIEVRAFLGGNVRATGVMKSNAATIPFYNERTQEMIWQLPKIDATTGVIGKPIEAIFQVEAVPSTNDLNRDMLLIQDSSLTATDDFTGVALSSQDDEITTGSLDDQTVSGQGTVLQQPQVLQLQQTHLDERQKLLLLLAQQKASRAEQDAQLAELQARQSSAQTALERQLQKLRDAYKPPVILPPVIAGGEGGGVVVDEECANQAASNRDAEFAAVDDNHDDDLNAALEKRRNLLIAAALVGDPHLRHILIVAALVGYEKDEKEIEEDWNEGRAAAQRKYQQDMAACNGGAGL
ncbi:MAG: hypothetical protein Q7S83_03110 [bacterium]|nr:hypothetical protein [bacterium]